MAWTHGAVLLSLKKGGILPHAATSMNPVGTMPSETGQTQRDKYSSTPPREEPTAASLRETEVPTAQWAPGAGGRGTRESVFRGYEKVLKTGCTTM